jgi:hypothetical protein
MPSAIVIGLFCTYLILIKKSQQSRGRLKACPAWSDLQCSNHHRDSRARHDKDFFPTGVLCLGCCHTPSGTPTSHTVEGMFDKRCRSIDVPKHTLMKIEHVSSIYANETISVSVLVFLTC